MYRIILLILFLQVFLSGCLSQVKRNVEAANKAGAVVGSISSPGKDLSRVVVVAVERVAGGYRIYNYTHVKTTGRFILRVETGRVFTVVAFVDENANLLPDPGEAAGVMNGEVNIRKDARLVTVEMALGVDTHLPGDIQAELVNLPRVQRKPLPVTIGEIADLSDPRFSAEYGEKGLWEFFDFLTNAGIGVYFLEPYDAGRIPVLFVNGAGGSPQDWVYYFNHLDREKYQAWFFYYPSGARLDSTAETLNSIVKRLQQQYLFKRLYVTAHSMGGLVSRGFIHKALYGDNAQFIKLFVTISTPWQGHSAARFGVELAPATIPSWIDMVPGSDYQKKIFVNDVGERVPYYLLFGYRGGGSLFSENNDGAVTLTSMLFPQAQKESHRVYGFNEDHTSILSSAVVFETYQRILDAAGRE